MGRNRLQLRFGELIQLSTYPSALLDAPSPQASRVGKCFFAAINPALYPSVTPISVVRQTARQLSCPFAFGKHAFYHVLDVDGHCWCANIAFGFYRVQILAMCFFIQ